MPDWARTGEYFPDRYWPKSPSYWPETTGIIIISEDEMAVIEVIQKWLDNVGVQLAHYTIDKPMDFNIPSGEDGTGTTPVTLNAPMEIVGILCIGAAGIPGGTNMSAQIAWDSEASTPMADLYEENDPGTQWSQGNLPTSGAFAFILKHGYRARRYRIILSQNVTATTTFKIYGFDGVQ
jgi:hypothetical protein